ncbi:MAG: thiamine-phosphate kinase [Myxococcota bacterium]|nr:thiamine-phosphate kinase [Myxococcota bacterium]
MRLRDVGEFGLVERIERAVAKRPVDAGVVLGIGDDAAILRPRSGEDVVVTTDALVEDVHFRWKTAGPRTVGRRAMVASLSDLAAMGARPLGCVVSLVAPPALDLARVDGLVAGLVREAATHRCPLVGGNLSRGRETSLAVTALGAVRRGRALTRAGARAGDRIFVTGTLGAAALGVARAERRGAPARHVAVPRLEAGRALARLQGVGGCIDVSDGLDADLGHLLAGPLEARIDPARIPLPRGFRAACARLDLDPLALARGGGEDYELLFTLRPAGPSEARLGRLLGLPVREIGEVVTGRGRRRSASPSPGGWRHF